MPILIRGGTMKRLINLVLIIITLIYLFIVIGCQQKPTPDQLETPTPQIETTTTPESEINPEPTSQLSTPEPTLTHAPTSMPTTTPIITPSPTQHTPSPCPAGSPPAELIYYPRSGKSWDINPSVTISAMVKDGRIKLVYDAVDFWNQQLAEMGTPFRFGPVTRTTELVPTDYLVARSSAGLEGKPFPEIPESVKNIPGDIIIALSDGNFVSQSGMPGSKYCIIGIRNFKVSPLNLTNVGRNIIAHELGHAIGLGHHNDCTKLMGGRPAECRPNRYHCDVEQYFAITEENKAYLLELYPTTWKPAK
jgi:hypothetical protein